MGGTVANWPPFAGASGPLRPTSVPFSTFAHPPGATRTAELTLTFCCRLIVVMTLATN